MGNIIFSIIATAIAAGGSSLVMYGVMGLFVNSKKIKIGVAAYFFLVGVIALLFFKIDEDISKIGVIIGAILTGYGEYRLLFGGNSDEKK